MDIDNIVSTSTYIPLDIILIILSRLPVKCLFKFRTVCKSWSDIISNILFVLCTCEGVVLIKLIDSTYALWNPSTQTKTTFLCPFSFPLKDSTGKGLCYDPSTKEYKVVFIDVQGQFAVYSCQKKTWILKKTQVSYCDFRGSGVFVDGAVYWVANYDSEIIYFDAKDDEVKTLQKLERNVQGNEHYNLVCLGGRLCLYCNVWSGHETAVRIWAKDGAGFWGEWMTIKNVMQMPIEPLRFVENKIHLRVGGTRFVAYSPHGETFEELFEDVSKNGGLVPCARSMFQSKKRKRCWDGARTERDMELNNLRLKIRDFGWD